MVSKQDLSLGQKIKKLRLKQGFSQDELARLADIPYTTLTKIESGKIKNPSFSAVVKVAKALNIKLDNLS